MNKIYSDQIEKARSLSAGIAENASLLSRKGLNPDMGKLNEKVQALTEAANRQEDAEKALYEARAKAHELLDELKALYNEAKAPIKLNYLPEEWAKFGLPDKR